MALAVLFLCLLEMWGEDDSLSASGGQDVGRHACQDGDAPAGQSAAEGWEAAGQFLNQNEERDGDQCTVVGGEVDDELSSQVSGGDEKQGTVGGGNVDQATCLAECQGGLGGIHAAQRAIGQGGGQVGEDHGTGLGGCQAEGRADDQGGGQGGNQGTGLCGCHDEHRAVDQGSGEDGEHNACQVGWLNDVHAGHCDEEVDAGSGHTAWEVAGGLVDCRILEL